MNCEIFWPGNEYCSGNGKCLNGTCMCDNGWSGYGDFVLVKGTDCTVNKDQQQLTSILILILLLGKLLYGFYSLSKGYFGLTELHKKKSSTARKISPAPPLSPLKKEGDAELKTDAEEVYDKVKSNRTSRTSSTRNSLQKIFSLKTFKKFFKNKVRSRLDVLCIIMAGFMAACEYSKLFLGQSVGHDVLATTCYAVGAASFHTFFAVFLKNWITAAVSSDFQLRKQMNMLLKWFHFSLKMGLGILYLGCISLFLTPILVQEGDDVNAFKTHMQVYHIVIIIGCIWFVSYLIYFGRKLVNLIDQRIKNRLDSNKQQETLNNQQQRLLRKKMVRFIACISILGISVISIIISVLTQEWLWNRSHIVIARPQQLGAIFVELIGLKLIKY